MRAAAATSHGPAIVRVVRAVTELNRFGVCFVQDLGRTAREVTQRALIKHMIFARAVHAPLERLAACVRRVARLAARGRCRCLRGPKRLRLLLRRPITSFLFRIILYLFFIISFLCLFLFIYFPFLSLFMFFFLISFSSVRFFFFYS